MKVLVCGSRSWLARNRIGRRLVRLPDDATIIHGGAPGADRIAASYARALGIPETAYRADWSQGRQAGVVRNLQMLDEKPDLVIAFWDGESRGTKHTIDEARRRGIPVEVISTT